MNSFVQFVIDQLTALSDVRSRAMFGGYGLYAGEAFFGIIHDGRLFFRTSPETVKEYIDHGMKHFEPKPGQALKNYFEVPVDVIEDDSELVAWARRSIETRS